LYLDRATELADRMLPVFETPSGLPFSMVNLGLRQGTDASDSPGIVSTAEAATLQLELRYLSFLTENDEYWDRAENVCMFVVVEAMLLMTSKIGHENHQSSKVAFGLSSNIYGVSHCPSDDWNIVIYTCCQSTEWSIPHVSDPVGISWGFLL
jgi:Glycosyl hydrolase family 47